MYRPTLPESPRRGSELDRQAKEEDVGWLPGPVNGMTGRAIPSFMGKPMGAANRRWSSATTPSTIMKKVHLSNDYVDYIHRAAPCALEGA